LEGEVVRYVPYGVFIRVFQDINGLIHLSELSHKTTQNPNEVVKLGQIVKAKIILLDPKNRKIGLSMKGVNEPTVDYSTQKAVAKKTSASSKKGLEDIVKKLAEEKTVEKVEEKPAKKVEEKKEEKKTAKKVTKKVAKKDEE